MAAIESRVKSTHLRHNPPTSRRRRFMRVFWLPAVLLLAIAAGGLTGIVAAYQLNYSQAASEVASLATYRASVVTRVYANDGTTVIGEFALEKRIPLKYSEMTPLIKNAILAIEDARFYDHIGIDPIRIVGATFKNITTGSREGGSTLTQQLAKNLFLSREQTITRKMNEWLVALQIERYYTKQQIMEMYANHIFLGAGAYGIEAGAETYFNKHVKDLTLDEAALLAGIPKAPGQYSPTVDPVAAKERRNVVLDQMARYSFVSQSEADAAKSKPIALAETVNYQSQQRSTPFDYPVEQIRQDLEDKYTTRVAQGGLTVYTTIDVEAQKLAFNVVRARLRQYDRSHAGWHSSYNNIATTTNGVTAVTREQLENFKYPDWYTENYVKDAYVMGLIMKVDQSRNEVTVRFGNFTATVTASDMGWGQRQPRQEFKPGDLAEFEIKEVDLGKRRLDVELSQIPGVQGAMMTLNAKTGEVIAMVGGYDFYTGKFNNATQAYRQTGSAFKPFIYTAALEWGMKPDSIVSGAEIKRGNWTPHNYDGSTSNGDLPLKVALAKSMNIPAVHLLDMVGIQTGAQMVRRFGITVPMAPYLPSALGATEVPLDQMVSAYSAFPNKGVRVQPHLIRKVLDRDGNVLEEWEKTTYKVVNSYVALTMVSMMRGVIENGTATDARVLGVPLGGKTGTVNDHTDVWFVGYTPTYVTGVWMGYPGRKKPLGNDMTGGHGALPFFIDFMKGFLKGKPKEDFEKPPGIPEDMKELNRQRQREMSEERSKLATASKGKESATEGDTTGASTEPKLEQVTLPPAPRSADDSSSSSSSGDTTKKPDSGGPARNDGATRPREVEAPKKKGKKGSTEP
jgi:penicillin-binding protein 1A